jgi:hypothetical protein
MSTVESKDIPVGVTRGERTHLCIYNRSGSDLHVRWTNDVDQDDVRDFIHNNNDPPVCRRSRKVDLEADFRLEVYRNNDGKPGTEIGSPFHIKVLAELVDVIVLGRQGNNLVYLRGSGLAQLIGSLL